MKFKNIFTLSWYICFMIYLLFFLVSIAGVATVVDEYDGGDHIAEIAAGLFDLFMFPLIILDWLRIDVEPNSVFYLLLFLNFIVNSFVITSLLNLCYLQLRQRLIRISR